MTALVKSLRSQAPGQPDKHLGKAPLFLGVQTHDWTMQQLESAAHYAKSVGFSSLLLKVADGTIRWYNPLGGYGLVLDTLNKIMPTIAYTYDYGDTFGGLQGEIALKIELLKRQGVAVADMEDQFNGQVGWATVIANALYPVPGVLGVTSWADPAEQNWLPVLKVLRQCTDFWLPQVYSNYLSSVYHAQYDPYTRPYYPVVNLGTDYGANDPVHIAKTSNSPCVAFWEYGRVASWATQCKQIITTVGK